MKKKLVFWVEEYFYNPNLLQKLLSFLLLPLSWLYCFGMYVRYLLQKPKNLGIAVVSVGNLNVGGSGKTPLVSALAQHYNDAAIVLRGYGRTTKGLLVVKSQGAILCDVAQSGDEAMIYAKKLPHAIVIVSEDRIEGITKAKEMGAKLVFLDDGYSKHTIKKLSFVIEVQSQNSRCLPSGPFRERLWEACNNLLLQEGKDFKRVVQLQNKSDKMSLVTAIARPSRLEPFLPETVGKNYFEDHHLFTKEELEQILQKEGSDSLLVTYKDYVKIESFGLNVSLLDLHVEVDPKIFEIINSYVEVDCAKKD